MTTRLARILATLAALSVLFLTPTGAGADVGGFGGGRLNNGIHTGASRPYPPEAFSVQEGGGNFKTFEGFLVEKLGCERISERNALAEFGPDWSAYHSADFVPNVGGFAIFLRNVNGYCGEGLVIALPTTEDSSLGLERATTALYLMLETTCAQNYISTGSPVGAPGHMTAEDNSKLTDRVKTILCTVFANITEHLKCGAKPESGNFVCDMDIPEIPGHQFR